MRYRNDTEICFGDGSCVFLPKIRTSIGKRSFAYQGAMIYNDSDKSLRDETSLMRFRNKISQFVFKVQN